MTSKALLKELRSQLPGLTAQHEAFAAFELKAKDQYEQARDNAAYAKGKLDQARLTIAKLEAKEAAK